MPQNLRNQWRIFDAGDDPPLIRQILTHNQRREALLTRVALAPPDSKQTPVAE